jgi:hypothetical protein
MIAVVVLAFLASAVPAAAQTEERIADVRVHGNHTTPDADVLAISGLAAGDPATAERLQQAEARLRASRRFEGVEVRRRFASIADPTAILVVIVVNEHPGAGTGTPIPGPLRRLRLATMWVPILGYADGYGFTYGLRFAFIDPFGPRTRISVPLTWGGERRAGVETERTFERGPLTSATGSVSVYRHVNPHYDVPDLRLEARGRVERVLTPWLRAGAGARTARVEFAGAEARHTAAGADVELDTRLDPSFPRNAVHALVGWEHLSFDGGSAGRLLGDLRGYAAVHGPTVLALRAQFAHARDALPRSEQPLLGGSGSLRGYRIGHRAGDSMAAVSAELRVPLTSPLTLVRIGAKAFVDAGTTWSSSERLADRAFDRGIGGGVYAGVAAAVLNVDVAWAESGKARGHVGFGVTF